MGHSLHALLLLAPTCVGGWLFDWPLAMYASCLVLAGIVEDYLVGSNLASNCRISDLTNMQVRDLLAVKVAQAASLLLLLTMWLGQLEYHLKNPADEKSAMFILLGVLLALSGIALRASAIWTLGTDFNSDITLAGPVVKNGVYAWVRHPSEIGLILIATGSLVTLSAFFSFAMVVSLLIPISLWRVRREDRFLASQGRRAL